MFREGGFTRVGDHSKRGDSLFLDVSLHLGLISTRIQQSKKSFNDRIEVRDQCVVFNSFTKIDEGGGGMRMYSREKKN